MLQKMEHLIANIHYGDMNLSFPIPSTDGPEANLTRAMNEALSAFRTRLYNVVVAEAEAEEEPKQETAPAAVVPPRQVEAQADDAAVYDLDTLTVLIMDGVPRIRLDATLEDRRLFTELRNALKNAGYRFDGKTQSWYFPEAA